MNFGIKESVPPWHADQGQNPVTESGSGGSREDCKDDPRDMITQHTTTNPLLGRSDSTRAASLRVPGTQVAE